MIHTSPGQEQQEFIFFIENALSKLAQDKYSDFLNMFDISRISYEGLILALKYLDEDREIVRVDNPLEIKSDKQHISLGKYKNQNGYYMDYDLTTDGQLNDLTLHVEFLWEKTGWIVSLEDLHTL